MSVLPRLPSLSKQFHDETDGGWPRALRRFADEAWRRAEAGEIDDAALYPCDAQWAGIFDRLKITTREETQRRTAIAAGIA